MNRPVRYAVGRCLADKIIARSSDVQISGLNSLVVYLERYRRQHIGQYSPEGRANAKEANARCGTQKRDQRRHTAPAD